MNILDVRDLWMTFNTRHGPLTAVAGISFTIKPGEIFGLVGESGSGKTTVGSLILGMYKGESGQVIYKGEDIHMLAEKRLPGLKREIQLVFQDPGGSLNPRQTIRQILSLPLKLYAGISKGRRLEEAIEEVLLKTGLPLSYLDKYPGSIGGGEKQLICIARALAANPSFIVLDEPTSALDVSIQAKISNKLLDIQKEFGLSYLFITHNLCLVRNIVHRTAIMYLGKVCEVAITEEFFHNPLHPYTRMLLSSIPVISDDEEQYKPLKTKSVGEIPNPLNRPKGCGFRTRCPSAKTICGKEEPSMVEISDGHHVSCHLYAGSIE